MKPNFLALVQVLYTLLMKVECSVITCLAALLLVLAGSVDLSRCLEPHTRRFST